MNRFDEFPVPPQDPAPESESKTTQPDVNLTPLPLLEPAPITVAPPAEPALSPQPSFPEDLQISWSWLHFLIFAFFGAISLITIQGVLMAYLAPHHHMSAKEFEKYLLSNPKFTIGSMLLWYAALFFFLYVTLSVLRGHSFWECLGWRKINPMRRRRSPGRSLRPKSCSVFKTSCHLSKESPCSCSPSRI